MRAGGSARAERAGGARGGLGKRTSCGCVRGEGLEDGRDATVCLNRASGAAKMNLVAEATVAPSGARAQQARGPFFRACTESPQMPEET